MTDFVHLHNHSDFSLQDGAQTVQMLCDRCDDLGMDAIALTEHGNLFSMIPFYKESKKRGLKPILGCEVYVAVNSYTEKKQIITSTGKKWGYHHLVLLVQNHTGYKNLMKLVSIGYLEGFYYRPRIDKNLLKKYNEGLIATSGCLAGEITQFASNGDYENAKKAAIEYNNIFPDRFYLELQNHQIPEEKAAHKILKKLSDELHIPLVATNDCHYALEDHWEAHDVLFCLGTDKNRNDINRVKYEPRQFYIKSTDEMYKIFKEYPSALENTIKIAESCNLEIPMGEYHLPNFPMPKSATSQDPNEYLKLICLQGLKEKYPNLTDNIKQRLQFELDVIKKMGFAGYFLITQDFVKYAKTNQIPVGPGRGSAAGSIVAYCTGITDVDPIKYNLLFERFLNPERVTMPDIDIDFCIEGRDRVINYIKDRYGQDSVAQIITFGKMKAKSVVRDVGRVLGLQYSEVDQIAKMIPDEQKITLEKAEKLNPDLKKIKNTDKTHKELMKFSKVLEGMNRHASTHAAGVVITPGPLTNYVPLFKSPSSEDVVTQTDMIALEDLGLLKMDFLGLRNLTVINKTIKLIEGRHRKIISANKLNLNDKDVYSLFADGNTTGIFQFESTGMTEYLKQLKPSCIEDLIAMNALYRPGPMANIPEFIARKHGKSPINYLHPKLEPILKETYGIMLYQEQVMQISQIIGGFTLAQGDMMRRAMGKKKIDEMAAFKIDFVNGAINQNIKKDTAISIFELMEKFAQYGFNKSHSTAYALVAYQTAWLKFYYPAEFLAANLSSEMDNTDRVVTLIEAAKEMNIEILPPNVNSSYSEFHAITDTQIAFGLAAIKNIGSKAAEKLVEYRIKNGLFSSILDICKIDSRLISRKVLESLIKVGAVDIFKGHRAQLLASIDDMISIGQKYIEELESNQSSLFDNDETNNNLASSKLELLSVDAWTKDEELRSEKELLGFYLSGDPLSKYHIDIDEFSNIDLSNPPSKKPSKIFIGGIIDSVSIKFDKKNNPWAIISLSNKSGKLEIFVFNDIYEKYKNLLSDDFCVFAIGTPSNREEFNKLKIIANRIIPLDQVRKQLSKNINIKIDKEHADVGLIHSISSLTKKHSGRCNIIFHFLFNGSVKKIISNNIQVEPSNKLLSDLRTLTSHRDVWIS